MSNSLRTLVVLGIGLVIQGIAVLIASWKRSALTRALLLPASILIWGVAATYAVDIWVSEPGLSEWLSKLRLLAVVGAVAWALVRLQKGLGQRWWGRLMVCGVLVAALLVALQVMGINISGILAFGGFGAVAVGIAGRELFANLFGGRMLFLTQAFCEGERIRAPKAGVAGVVKRIGWYQTTLLADGDSPMTIPNAFFMSELVINESRAQWQEQRLHLRVQAEKLDQSLAQLKPLVNTCELQAIVRDVALLELTTRTPLSKVQLSPFELSEQLRKAVGEGFVSLRFE